MKPYIVQHTPVLHGIEDKVRRFEPGETIELTEEQALRLGDNVAPAADDAGMETETGATDEGAPDQDGKEEAAPAEPQPPVGEPLAEPQPKARKKR